LKFEEKLLIFHAQEKNLDFCCFVLNFFSGSGSKTLSPPKSQMVGPYSDHKLMYTWWESWQNKHVTSINLHIV